MAASHTSAALAVADVVASVLPKAASLEGDVCTNAAVAAASPVPRSPRTAPAHLTQHHPPSPTAAPNAAHNGAHGLQHHHHHTKNNKWKHQSPPPPTNCVVLKNLDYSITQPILEDVVRRVTEGQNDFVNITLIDDKHTGTFRGMAFVNFHTTRDATAALAELSKMVINNRRVIAEYRRLRPGEKKEHTRWSKKYDNYNYNHRQTFEKDIQPQVDANGVAVDKRVAFFAKRDTARKDAHNNKIELKTDKDKLRDAQFRALLTKYANDELKDSKGKDVVFDASLTSYERKMVHHICDSLNLGHISRFDDAGNRLLHVTKDPERAAEWEKEAMEAKAEARRLALEQKRKARDTNVNLDRKSDANTVPASPEELQGINWFKPRSAMNADGDADNGTSGIRAPTFKTYVPPRKPKGPDGTAGFTARIELHKKRQAELAVQDDDSANGHVDDGGHREEDQPTSQENDDDTDGSCLEKSSCSDSSPTKSGKGTHSVLNPSVPAFSPSYQTFY